MVLQIHWDEMFNESISNLDKYKDVDRLDEIKNLMKGFRKDKFYKELANIHNGDRNGLIASENRWAIDFDKIPKINIVKKGLGRDILPFYLPHYQKLLFSLNFYL